jgi:hypothetical protein
VLCAVNAEDHGLAVDDELPVPVFQSRLDDPRVAVRPVVAAPGDQSHAVAVALKAQAIDPMQGVAGGKLLPPTMSNHTTSARRY